MRPAPGLVSLAAERSDHPAREPDRDLDVEVDPVLEQDRAREARPLARSGRARARGRAGARAARRGSRRPRPPGPTCLVSTSTANPPTSIDRVPALPEKRSVRQLDMYAGDGRDRARGALARASPSPRPSAASSSSRSATPTVRPAAAAAAASASASASVTVIGFSTSTWAPASSAATACSRWRLCGDETTTPSTPAARSSATELVATSSPNSLRKASRPESSLRTAPTRSTSGWSR